MWFKLKTSVIIQPNFKPSEILNIKKRLYREFYIDQHTNEKFMAHEIVKIKLKLHLFYNPNILSFWKIIFN